MNQITWRSARVVGPAVTLLALVLLATGIGSSWIGPDRVLLAVFGQGSATDTIIIWTLRLPRVALAVLAGAALGLAGLLLQRVVRNPIASPSVLGIVDGAAVGVVLFLWVFSNEANALMVSIQWQPMAATAGATTFAVMVAILAGRDIAQPARLILYGIAMAALAKSLVTVLVILGPVYRASQALIWLAGSVHAAHWEDAAILSIVLVTVLCLLALLRRSIGQMVLDDTTATATGLVPVLGKGVILILSVVLTSAAVSFAGGIAFVGLIAPNAARALVGLDTDRLLFVTPIVGAAMVLCADIIARVVAYPLELPTGAVTALVGAPYFLFLLLRQIRHV
ncbi:FecCD family ABC transporter permease [Loktanella agnita]|uniref:FecCD family ABC transporter permease n=1 Tax=Loktanella agnita TaxID=287097 RepID=UPI0039879620